MSFSGEKGLRVDRVIKCEPFDTVLNKSVKIAFTYKFFGEDDYYRAEYKFDVVKKGPRVVWIHKDNNQVGRRVVNYSIMEIRWGDRTLKWCR